jgi:tyrosinase
VNNKSVGLARLTTEFHKRKEVAMKVKSRKRKSMSDVAEHGDHAGHDLGENCHTMSFADMLRLQPEVRQRLKFPIWLLFPTVVKRKSQSALTQLERNRFLCAFNTLVNNGTYGQLVDIHAQPHQMHGTQRFLPWHRIYLLKLEQALQAIHPDVTLPYWDWTKPADQEIPSWLAGVTPTITTPTRTIVVNRFPQSKPSLATLASNIPSIMTQTSFATFTSQLESVHGGVHVWVGGAIGSIPTAPADIIFWMHHANIDRLWWMWQNSAAGSGKNPSLSGAAAVMDPWASTETDTRDINALGYTYA